MADPRSRYGDRRILSLKTAPSASGSGLKGRRAAVRCFQKRLRFWNTHRLRDEQASHGMCAG